MENRNALHGILGVIGQEIHANEGYEQAISEALGGAMYNIVTSDEEAARNAIRFLKKNQSGRATFLPVNVCQKRSLSQEASVICSNTKGFLGVASEFVTCEDRFQPVVDYLLNNVLVVDSMEAGNNLSSLTGRRYNIVTTDGEVIHRGGSMTGGKMKRSTTPITAAREAENIRRSIDAQTARVELSRRESEKAVSEREEITRRLQQNRISAASLEPVVDAKQAKFEKLKNDLALLAPDQLTESLPEEEIDDTVVRLNHAYSERDRITAEIKAKRERRSSSTVRLIVRNSRSVSSARIRTVQLRQSMRFRSTRVNWRQRLKTTCSVLPVNTS